MKKRKKDKTAARLRRQKEKLEEFITSRMTPQQEFERLIHLCSQLEGIEIMGLCRMLGVEVDQPFEKGEKPQPRPTTDIITDIADKFLKLSTRRKKEIFKLLEDAIKCSKEV